MASPETFMSYGAQLSYSTTPGGSYTVVGGVKDLKWSGDKPSADVSALEDTTIVRLPKRADDGSISGTVLTRKTVYNFLFTAHRAGTKYYWKIGLPDNAGAVGSVLGPWYGNLSKLGMDVNDDAPVEAPFTIELSGVTGNTPAFVPG